MIKLIIKFAKMFNFIKEQIIKIQKERKKIMTELENDQMELDEYENEAEEEFIKEEEEDDSYESCYVKYEQKVIMVDDNLEANLSKLGSEGFRVVATVSGGASNAQRIIMEKEIIY